MLSKDLPAWGLWFRLVLGQGIQHRLKLGSRSHLPFHHPPIAQSKDGNVIMTEQERQEIREEELERFKLALAEADAEEEDDDDED